MQTLATKMTVKSRWFAAPVIRLVAKLLYALLPVIGARRTIRARNSIANGLAPYLYSARLE